MLGGEVATCVSPSPYGALSCYSMTSKARAVTYARVRGDQNRNTNVMHRHRAVIRFLFRYSTTPACILCFRTSLGASHRRAVGS